MESRINIERELNRIRKRNFDPQEALLQEAKRIIRYGHIRTRQPAAFLPIEYTDALSAKLNADRIYSLQHIRAVCVRYRLRFLDLSMYRHELPPVALQGMVRLEKKLGKKLNYRLIAPASIFKLEDRDKDPLLFAEIGENKYYLVASWGEDLSWSRRIMAFPLQSLETFLATLATAALIATMLIPAHWLVGNEALHDDIFYYRGLFFVWFLVASFFFLVFIGMTFRKNFNDAEWNSGYFN